MIVSATDVKGSESLLDNAVAPVKKSASTESADRFSDRLNENISKNNEIKEKHRADNQKPSDQKVTNEEASKAVSRSEAETSKTASSPPSNNQTEPKAIAQPSKNNGAPSGKTLPEGDPQAAVSLLDIAEAGETAGLGRPIEDKAPGLQQLIKEFSETVTGQVAAGSDQQVSEDDAELISILPVSGHVTPVAGGAAADDTESEAALLKPLPGGETARMLTQQAPRNALDTHGHRAIDPALAGTVAMDAGLQKSPFEIPHGLQKTMGQVSDAFNVKWTESQAESALPKVSVANRVESSSAYVNPANPLLTDSASVSEKISLDRPITHVRWSQDLGERVQWMMSRSMNGAEIRLNPPQLGPMEVRIQMQQDQASVAFTSQHASVREAIEAALPRLRELLGQQSLNLVNVDISQHSFSDQRQQGQMGEGGFTGSPWAEQPLSDPDLSIEQAATTWSGPVYDGLINTYV